MKAARRHFVQTLAATLVANGLAQPAWTADVAPADEGDAFAARTLAAALARIHAADSGPAGELVLTAPEVAENGAAVPIAVECALPGPTRMWVLVDNNPFPLALDLSFAAGHPARFQARLKMADSSPLRVIAEAAGRRWTALREVKVTVGGCGEPADAAPPQPPAPPAPIKLRASLVGDRGEVRILVPHTMESGLRHTADGRPIPADHLVALDLTLNGRTAIAVRLGSSVSADPFFAFTLAGVQAGDRLEVSWLDTAGRRADARAHFPAA